MSKIVLIVIVGVMLVVGCSKKLYQNSTQSGEGVMDKRFSNDRRTEVMNSISFREHLQLYKEFFFVKGEKYPSFLLPQQKLGAQKIIKNNKGIVASWLGHSSLLLNIDGVSILTDPVFEKKVSIVGPARFNKEHPLDFDTLPAVDVVIISHNHYDHLNKFTIKYLKDRAGLFVVPRGIAKLLRVWGVEENKIAELDWYQSYETSAGLVITATPGQHFSGRGIFDRNKSLWASWVLKSADSSVFFSGDSGYFTGFKDIGERFGPFDVTFLECGAYNERWSQVHMFPEQTVQAFVDLGGKVLQPIHWGTYNLALHPWHEPVERLVKESESLKINLSIPVMGAIVDYTNIDPHNYWWRPAMEKEQFSSNNTALVLNER